MVKELVILSGKGGTGKTSISASLAYLAPAKVLADCDVDAANLHMLIGAKHHESHDYYAGFEPVVDEKLCRGCGKCTELCRFGAMKSGVLSAPLACEGCGVCAFHCPEHAISMRDKNAGRWLIADSRFGQLVHAELGLTVENSGKLVSRVKQEARRLAEKEQLPLIITDGPPGIGCPAIASMAGANLVLAVVEPSLSAIHDFERLRTLCGHFKIPVVVCINKSTLSAINTQTLKSWLAVNEVAVVGEIPYDSVFRNAVQSGLTVMEADNPEVQEKLLELWFNVSSLLAINPQGSIAHRLENKLKSLSGAG